MKGAARDYMSIVLPSCSGVADLKDNFSRTLSYLREISMLTTGRLSIIRFTVDITRTSHQEQQTEMRASTIKRLSNNDDIAF